MRKERPIDPSTLRDLIDAEATSGIDEIELIPIGEVNEVYELRRKEGSSLVMRISRRGGDILEHERWALDQSREKGVPTPKTIAIRHAEIDEEPVDITIQEKMEGVRLSQIESDQDVLKNLGITIARIHEVQTEGFGWTSPEGRGIFNTWDEYLLKALSKKDSLLDIARRNSIDTAVIEDGLELIATNSNIYQGEARLVHRDLGPDHILVDEGVVSGVIDFENCVGADPIYDLARWDLLYGDEYPIDQILVGYRERADLGEDFDKRMQVYKIHSGISVALYLDQTNEMHRLIPFMKDIFNIS